MGLPKWEQNRIENSSWVIPSDCMPASNSLKVKNLSPSVFHCLKAVFVSFFLTLVEVLPISKIISLFEKFNCWLLLVSQILPLKYQTYSLLNNFFAFVESFYCRSNNQDGVSDWDSEYSSWFMTVCLWVTSRNRHTDIETTR